MWNIFGKNSQHSQLRASLIIILVLAISSCSSDDPTTPPSDPIGLPVVSSEQPDTAGWIQQGGTHDQMNCLWGASSNDVYAAGMNGSILHYSGGTEWNPHFLLPGITWQELWGASADTFYAVGSTEYSLCCPGSGDVGVIYRSDNGQWQQVVGLAHVVFSDIWGSSNDDIYAVGTNNQEMVIAHFDGQSWQTITEPATELSAKNAGAVWGSSASDVFIAGHYGQQTHIIHFDGQTWQRTETPGELVSSMWGSGPTDVYACDTSGNILHYDGNNWVVEEQYEQPLFEIFGFDTGEIFISGIGIILQKTAGGWTETSIASPRFAPSTGPHEYYSSIWGATPERMFTIGRANNFGGGYTSNFFLSFEGGRWQLMQPPSGANIFDIWGVGDYDIYAVGGLSTLLHFNGARWLPLTIPNLGTWPSADGTGDDFLSVWASGPDDIFIGTRNGLWRFDGMQWIWSEAFEGAVDLWGTGPQDVYAVEFRNEGGSGPFQIMHFDGSTWTSIGEFTQRPLRVHGLENGSIVLIGYDGLCQLYEHSTWTDLDTGDSDTYVSIWGHSTDKLYLGRSNNPNLNHFNGVSWEDINLTYAGFTSRLILGNSPDNLFVLSDQDERIIHFDGTEGNIVSHEGFHPRGGWSGEDFLVAGGRGRLFHKPVSGGNRNPY